MYLRCLVIDLSRSDLCVTGRFVIGISKNAVESESTVLLIAYLEFLSALSEVEDVDDDNESLRSS